LQAVGPNPGRGCMGVVRFLRLHRLELSSVPSKPLIPSMRGLLLRRPRVAHGGLLKSPSVLILFVIVIALILVAGASILRLAILRLALLRLANIAVGGASNQALCVVAVAIKAKIFCLDIVLRGVDQVGDAADVLTVIPGDVFAILGVFGLEAGSPALTLAFLLFVVVLLRAGGRTVGVAVTVVGQGRRSQDYQSEDRGGQDGGDAHE
jgi:hypothetical protein